MRIQRSEGAVKDHDGRGCLPLRNDPQWGPRLAPLLPHPKFQGGLEIRIIRPRHQSVRCRHGPEVREGQDIPYCVSQEPHGNIDFKFIVYND